MLRLSAAATVKGCVSLNVSVTGVRSNKVLRVSLVHSFHSVSKVWNQNVSKNVTDTIKQLQEQTRLQQEKQAILEKDPQYKKLAKQFSGHQHDHVHLRESETEHNDSYALGNKNYILESQSQSHSHSHSHSHSELNELLVASMDKIKKNPGVRITWIGLIINVGIALGKFIGGIVFHSQALLADSVHAASDLVSDVLTLVSVNMASKTPTRDFPYGYGKIETVGSLAVSTILTMAGLSIGWSSLCAVVGPIIPHTIIETITAYIGSGHGHTHSHTGIPEGVTNINAAWIAGGSIVLKEWIFQATKTIAIKTNSNVLMANAWHHRVDSMTSLVALVAITSSYFFNIQLLDAVGGLLVSGLVIKAGGEGIISSLKELIDQSLSHDDVRYIKMETVIMEGLRKLVSNNNSGYPYHIQELTILTSGPIMRVHAILEAPLQRWENLLGIKEIENVTDYLRAIIKKNFNNVGKIEFEFVETQEKTTSNNTHNP